MRRRGRILHGDRWCSKTEFNRLRREAELDGPETSRKLDLRHADRTMTSPSRGHFQLIINGEPGPIAPKRDLHELLIMGIRRLVQGESISIVNCQGEEYYGFGRDPKSKRRFVQERRASRQSRIPLRKLEKDRIIVRDINDIRNYWVVT